MSNSAETKTVYSDCAICVNCCGVKHTVEDGKLVKVEGMKEHPATKGVICPKGERIPDIVYSPDRITSPMKKVNGKWEKVTWDQALDEIAEKLKKIKEDHGAKALALMTGSVGVERGEISFFAQRFKGLYGTPNMFSVDSGCFVSRLKSRVYTFGGYWEAFEVENSKCLILWGMNPHASRFPTSKVIEEKVESGDMKLIVIDPRKIPFAKKGKYISIRPGTDMALALGMINVIINEELYDKEFVEKWTFGFDKLTDHVQEYTPEKVSEITTIPVDDIIEIARDFANIKPSCIHQGFGALDRQTSNMQNARAIAILQAITGNIDVSGGWAMVSQLWPLLAELRVPVDEPGIGADKHPLFYRMPDGSPAPYGAETYFSDAVLNEDPYPLKALMVTCGNPANTHVDTEKFKKACEKLDLMVTMDMFMTETGELSDYFLPGASFVECNGLGGGPVCGVYGINYIILRRKVIEPVGDSKPDWQIWSELGRRMGFEKEFPWQTDEELFSHMYAPLEQSKGITWQQIKDAQHGIILPKEINVYKEKGFMLPTQKIELYSNILDKTGYDPLPKYVEPAKSPISRPDLAKDYPLILITGARALAYVHATLRHDPELRSLVPDPEAEIDPDTAKENGIASGDWIKVETEVGSAKFKAKVTKNIKPGVVSAAHGWPGESNINRVISEDDRDQIAGYPQDKAVLCRVVKA
jgi:anaerobic selenocysteine-containing dehydrogenase